MAGVAIGADRARPAGQQVSSRIEGVGPAVGATDQDRGKTIAVEVANGDRAVGERHPHVDGPSRETGSIVIDHLDLVQLVGEDDLEIPVTVHVGQRRGGDRRCPDPEREPGLEVGESWVAAPGSVEEHA